MNDHSFDKLFKHNDYRREIQVRTLENEDEQYWYLEGKAVAFDSRTVLFEYDGIDYGEKIDRHAFDNADISDVFLKFNHESSVMAAARTKNGTLELDIREDGVYVRVKLLKELRAAEDLYKAIRAGIIDKMSFAFSIAEQSYDSETRTYMVYRIKKVYDVAAVEIPAYDDTYIYARRKGEVEARLKSVEALRLERARKIALAKIRANKMEETNKHE